MANTQQHDSVHWLFGLALLLIGAFVIVALVILNTQADEVTFSSDIENAAPSVETIALADDLWGAEAYTGAGGVVDITPGTTKTLHFTGGVQDHNGQDDITNVGMVLTRTVSSSADFGCTADSNDCYTVPSCTIENDLSDTNIKNYDCEFDLSYWADSTSTGGTADGEDWMVEVTVTDGTETVTAEQARDIETTLALDIPTGLDFGSRTAPSTTTSSDNMDNYIITQHGNDVADVEVSMSDTEFTCDVRGDIDREDIEWSLTDVDYGDVATTDLSDTPATIGADLDYRTDDSNEVNDTVFWGLEVDSGTEGACSGTITVTAIEG